MKKIKNQDNERHLKHKDYKGDSEQLHIVGIRTQRRKRWDENNLTNTSQCISLKNSYHRIAEGNIFVSSLVPLGRLKDL
jgi:hypothetical protein